MNDNESSLIYSKKFSDFINKNSSDQINLNDITKILGNDKESSFQKGIRHVLHFGGDFSFYITINEKQFLVKGTIIKESGNCDIKDPFKFIGQENRYSGILITVLDFSNYATAEQELFNLKNILKKMKILINNISIPIWTRDKNNNIDFCNNAYAKLLETQPQYIVSRKWDLISNNKISKINNNNLEKNSFEITLNKNNITLNVTEVDLLNFDCELTKKIGFAIDVSNYKENECKAYNLLGEYQYILNKLNIAFIIINKNYNLDKYSDAFLNTFNIQSEIISQKVSFDDILEYMYENRSLPEYISLKEIKNNFLNLLKTDSSMQSEMWHMPDGKILNLKIYKIEESVVVVFEDITNELNLEAKYKSLLAVYNEIIERSNDAVLIISTDHRIKQCSKSCEDLLNINIKNILGSHIKDWIENFSSYNKIISWKELSIASIELRSNKCEYLELKNGKTLLYEYAPLPNGWHMIKFSKCIKNEEDKVNLFDDKIISAAGY